MKKNGLWDTVIKEKELHTEFDWQQKKKSKDRSVRITEPEGESPRTTSTSVDIEQVIQEEEDWDPVLSDAAPSGMMYKVMDLTEQFLHFFKSATDSQSKLGFDLYNAIFLMDFICFLFLVFFQGEFTGVQMSNVVEFFEQSRIPILYLTVIIIQFILIIVNRVIYLFRSLRSKLALLYVEIFIYNIFLCFYLPSQNGKSFGDSPSLFIFYLLKCLYMTFSALQICYGYPVFTKDKFLTKAVSDWREISFMIYRAIPFLFELTTLLDFIVVDTTLTFREFLKLEDLYSELFLVKCTIETNKRSGRKIGEKQPKFVKCTQGVLLFSSLVCLIWLPLLVLSSGNPANVPNLINEGTIYIGVKGWEPFFVQNQNEFISKISKQQYDTANHITDPRSNIQVTLFDADSEQLWMPTQPTEVGLMNELLSNTTASYLAIELLFTRDHPSDHLSIYNTYNVKLTDEQQSQLSEVINQQSDRTSVVVDNALPRFCELPLEGNIDFLSSSNGMISLNLTLNYAFVNISNGDGISSLVLERWWTISQIPDDAWSESGIQVATVSEDTAVGIAATIASTGLVGLYVGVVLSVGRFLRMWVSDLISRIYLDNMDHVDQLMVMIQDVFIARQYNDLLLEEYLYNELILLFRDPRQLLELTKKKE